MLNSSVHLSNVQGGVTLPAPSDNLHIPDLIYGREDELAVIQEAFQWASLGSTELVIVTGQPGIGKSALVQEAIKSAMIGKSYFASGKFDQYNTGIPYEPFIKCFQFLIRKLLTEPESALQKWASRVKEAVGPNGAVITKVIPEAKLLLGPFPPSKELPAMEARHRFEWAFHRFVQVFTRADHPLVLFFDDMQWADEASLRLLHSLIVDPESQNLLVIAAYREQEWKETVNSFWQWLQGKHAGYSVRQLALTPLEFEHIRSIVSDSLHCKPEDCTDVVHTLYVKTIGNPFYLKQLLKSSYENQGIRRNPANGKWECDSEVLDRLPEIGGQIGYWTDRIRSMPEQTWELLATSACLGSKFKARLLSAVSGNSEEETARHLLPAIYGRLLLAIEDHDADKQYQFIHDRIQQAAYSLLDNRRLMEIHLSAGRFLLEHQTVTDEEQVLYDIVNHFNQALSLSSAEELEMIVRLNEKAGRMAMESSAYSTALHYFKMGLTCLPDDFWSRRFEFTFQLHLQCAECEYLCGQYDLAESRLNDALRKARNWTEQAQVYKLKIEQYSNAGKYSQAIELGLGTLREVGIRISERPHKLIILKEILLTKRLLDKRMDELPTFPEIADPQAKAMLELLVALVAPTFFSNREVFAMITSKFIRLVYKYGSFASAPGLFAAYGMLLGTELGDYQTGYRLGKIAIDLADQSAIASVRCKVYVMFYGVFPPG